MKSNWTHIFLYISIMLTGISCDPLSKPEIRQVMGVFKNPALYTENDTIIRQGPDGDSVIYINSGMKANIIKMLRASVEFSKSDEMKQIKNIPNIDDAEKILLNKMDSLARSCDFPDFIEANRIRIKLMSDPAITELMKTLDTTEKRVR